MSFQKKNITVDLLKVAAKKAGVKVGSKVRKAEIEAALDHKKGVVYGTIASQESVKAEAQRIVDIALKRGFYLLKRPERKAVPNFKPTIKAGNYSGFDQLNLQVAEQKQPLVQEVASENNDNHAGYVALVFAIKAILGGKEKRKYESIKTSETKKDNGFKLYIERKIAA